MKPAFAKVLLSFLILLHFGQLPGPTLINPGGREKQPILLEGMKGCLICDSAAALQGHVPAPHTHRQGLASKEALALHS